MKFKKALIIIVALITTVCLCVGLAACDDSSSTGSNTDSSTDSGTTPPTPPDGQPGDGQGGFVNPGDNLGGGGVGTIPSQADSLTKDGVTVSDLSDLSQNVSYDGATVIEGSEDTLTITEAGNYVLKGEFKNGVVVNVANGETTHLCLDGAVISNQNGIALSNANKKSDLIVTLVADSQNTVSNAGDDANAIHVKGNLYINGTGSLSVTSESKNAIKVSKSLVIVNAQITVESQNHGIAARSVEAQNATITVNGAVKDGVNAECDDDTTEFPEGYTEGYVIFKNVNYTANVQGDGIQADTLAYIDGGSVNITANGTFVSYSSENMEEYDLETDDFRYVKSGSSYKKIASDSNYATSRLYALSQSCKGIKVGEIKYEDGDGNEVVVTDGALDAETGIIVQGGTLVALGSLGMVETPSTNSTQYILSYAQNSAIQAGETLCVRDSSGNVVLTFEAQKSCQSVIVSTPDFQNGATYTISNESGDLATFTISSIITSVGSSQSGGMRPGASGGQGGQTPPSRP